MATGTAVPAGLSPEEHRRQLRRAVIAGTAGTAIEWYDFFLDSIVTGLVFAKLYFPQSDPIGRHPAGLRHLRRRPHCTADRRGEARGLHEQGHIAGVPLKAVFMYSCEMDSCRDRA